MSLLDEQITLCEKYLKDIADGNFNDVESEISSSLYTWVNLYDKSIDGIGYCVMGMSLKEVKKSKQALISMLEFLRKYKEDNDRKSEEQKCNLEIAKLKVQSTQVNVNQNQTNSQKQNLNIKITLKQTIDVVNDISSQILSDDEKEILIGKLSNLEQLSDKKDKVKTWDKAKSILLWIADKSVDAGIALLPLLPFIQQAMQNL